MHYLHSIRISKVHSYATFASINSYEASALFSFRWPDPGRRPTPRIAPRWFYLYNVRAKIREQHATHGSSDDFREFDDINVLQGSCHTPFLAPVKEF